MATKFNVTGNGDAVIEGTTETSMYLRGGIANISVYTTTGSVGDTIIKPYIDHSSGMWIPILTLDDLPYVMMVGSKNFGPFQPGMGLKFVASNYSGPPVIISVLT